MEAGAKQRVGGAMEAFRTARAKSAASAILSPLPPQSSFNSRSLSAQVGEVAPFVHGQRPGEDRVMTPAGGDLVDHPGLADLEK